MADIQIETIESISQDGEVTILAMPERAFSGFADFLRERGVAGLAIGFIFGGAAQTLVQALMKDMINPALGWFLGPVGDLTTYHVYGFQIGDFISVLINFIILCFVIYLIFRGLHLERLDKPKG
jgi:large conductance mechanosensitive channel